MGYNKTEILAMKCRQLSRGRVKCYQIMMELFDAGREDILDELIKLMNSNYDAITPDQIIKTYDECGGKEGFLKRCNKIFNKRTLAYEQREYEYEEELKAYNCGESMSHPDGTCFDPNGKEINYD